MKMINSNIKYLCKKYNVRVKDLEKELDIKNNGLSRKYFYKNVKLSQLESIATKFNIPLELLIYVDLKSLTKSNVLDLFSRVIHYVESEY